MSATPVLDGFVLHKNSRRQPVGGRSVSKALSHSLQHPSPESARASRPMSEITPQFLIKRKTAVKPGELAHVELHEDRIHVSHFFPCILLCFTDIHLCIHPSSIRPRLSRNTRQCDS